MGMHSRRIKGVLTTAVTGNAGDGLRRAQGYGPLLGSLKNSDHFSPTVRPHCNHSVESLSLPERSQHFSFTSEVSLLHSRVEERGA